MTTVADAIRAKGGTNAPLSFPEGMAEAVRGIQSGGGSAVLYTEQNLTPAQQEQARANINASSNYARECSHLWFVRDNGEHYRDIVTAARSGGNPVVIKETDYASTTFIAPAIHCGLSQLHLSEELVC